MINLELAAGSYSSDNSISSEIYDLS